MLVVIVRRRHYRKCVTTRESWVKKIVEQYFVSTKATMSDTCVKLGDHEHVKRTSFLHLHKIVEGLHYLSCLFLYVYPCVCARARVC